MTKLKLNTKQKTNKNLDKNSLFKKSNKKTKSVSHFWL